MAKIVILEDWDDFDGVNEQKQLDYEHGGATGEHAFCADVVFAVLQVEIDDNVRRIFRQLVVFQRHCIEKHAGDIVYLYTQLEWEHDNYAHLIRGGD